MFHFGGCLLRDTPALRCTTVSVTDVALSHPRSGAPFLPGNWLPCAPFPPCATSAVTPSPAKNEGAPMDRIGPITSSVILRCCDLSRYGRFLLRKKNQKAMPADTICPPTVARAACSGRLFPRLRDTTDATPTPSVIECARGQPSPGRSPCEQGHIPQMWCDPGTWSRLP